MDVFDDDYYKLLLRLTITTGSSVADKPARHAASRQTANFLQQLRDHAPFDGDMSSCC